MKINGVSENGGNGATSTPPAYLTTTGNIGVPDPDKLLELNGNIVESVDGDVFTNEQGTPLFRNSPVDGKQWAYFSDTKIALTGGNIADFRVNAAVSFTCLAKITGTVSDRGYLYALGSQIADDNTRNTNHSVSTIDVLPRLGAFHEHGEGNNVLADCREAFPRGAVVALGVTRNSAGTEYNMFVNGRLFETFTVIAPTSGTISTLSVGGFPGGFNYFYGFLGCLTWWWSELTPTQMKAASDILLGT